MVWTSRPALASRWRASCSRRCHRMRARRSGRVTIARQPLCAVTRARFVLRGSLRRPSLPGRPALRRCLRFSCRSGSACTMVSATAIGVRRSRSSLGPGRALASAFLPRSRSSAPLVACGRTSSVASRCTSAPARRTQTPRPARRPRPRPFSMGKSASRRAIQRSLFRRRATQPWCSVADSFGARKRTRSRLPSPA